MNKKNTRAVTFSQPTDVDSACTEVDVVMDVIRRTFSDVLKPGQEFFLKAKSEDPDWDGVFVDVQVKDSLTDKSVVRAELKESDTDDTNKVGVWHECWRFFFLVLYFIMKYVTKPCWYTYRFLHNLLSMLLMKVITNGTM